MSDEPRDALQRLERRVDVLEQMMRRLVTPAAGAEPPAPTPRTAAPPVTTPSPLPSRSHPGPGIPDLEQWFGQRGLLAVGVAALLIAAALFLKYAFDRGWIPPLVRSLGAIVVGAGVGAWGHERIGRGMRRYGAALIGAGGGLVYLGLWAAAGPYGLLERRVGVLLLAATTIAVTLLALHHEVEGLAIWALAGAYLAPLLLPPPVPNAQAFLGYLEVIGLGTGVLAYSMGWRGTFDLALFGYLLLAALGASAALESPTGCWLVAAGALLTLHVTYRRPWPEARLGVLLVAWGVLGSSLGNVGGSDSRRWLALGAAAAVTGLLWWQQLRRDPFAAAVDGAAAVDRFLFVANPIAFVVLATTPVIPQLDRSPAIVPAVLGAIYLTAGWLRRAASLLIMGFALVALAMALNWPAARVAIGWTALAWAALAAEREAGSPGGRHAALGLATAAFVCLFSAALWFREPRAPVFSDAWALALYVFIAGAAVAARWWGTETAPALWKRGGTEWLWLLCAAAVFVGGSIEFEGYFGRITRLAGDLALSVWWLLYAGALVFVGFRLDRKLIRSAGLAVAAGAGLKIVLYDLSNLEALYRVASFFALALIALAVAYAYNKRARASAT